MRFLTKSGVYAVVACLYLAKYRPDSGYIAVKEVGIRLKIPYSYLSKIIQSLSSAGILKTRRCSGGGMALNRSTSGILLKEIIEAIDGPLTVPSSLIELENQSGVISFKSTTPEWNSIRSQIEAMFDTITLEKLASSTSLLLEKGD